MPTDTSTVEEPALRAFGTEYHALVVDEGTVVLDQHFSTDHERRDEVLELLKANHDEVSAEEVQDVLDRFGGADPERALQTATALYADFGVDLHLSDRQIDLGPSFVYTTLTEYGDGTGSIEHYGSRDERLTALRERALMLDDKHPAEFFLDADENECLLVLQYAIAGTKGRVVLFQAKRNDDASYIGYI